jgi:hypothetical protein
VVGRLMGVAVVIDVARGSLRTQLNFILRRISRRL